jgi:hypothetical protein
MSGWWQTWRYVRKGIDIKGATEVQNLILRDVNKRPFLLARVLWPAVCHAISAQRPDWKEDPGLFDLP